MLKISKVLFVLLLFYSLALASCPKNEVEFFVPAVLKPTASQIVKIKLWLQPGNGNIYVSTSPLVGLLTQQSTVRAVEYAFSNSSIKLKDCDVFLYFYPIENSNLVDGPSASLAIALATAAALNNVSYPSWAIVTGEIFSNGLVGPVGGVIDKIKAANSNKNITTIITPPLYFYERLILSSIEKNISVLEVKNFEQAYSYLFLNKSYSPTPSSLEVNIPTGLPYRKPIESELYFQPIATKINQRLEQTISNYSSFKNQELESYIDYFKKRTKLNNFLIEKGYFYSAANNAFLDLMDAKLLKQASLLNPNLEEEFKEVESCLNSYSQFDSVLLTKENFEFMAGSQARYIWAKTKFEKLKNSTSLINSLEDKYLFLREIYSAQSWCLAAVELAKISSQIEQKTPLNLTLLEKEIDANSKIISSFLDNNSADGFDDAALHLDYAKRAKEEKKYAASFFDLAYSSSVISFEKTKTEKEQVIKQIEKLAQKNYSGFWANLYQSQGQYLYFVAKNPEDYPASYSAFLLAEAQETFLTNLDEFVISNQSSRFLLNPTPSPTQLSILEDLLISFILLVAVFIALYLAIKK
ncbi:MAG: hypothetical protein N3D10_02485 [Candidatus Micrarchaeota archaeon]|nr:hypothetical protein [Candidatus Micrarchaeota archaeon]